MANKPENKHGLYVPFYFDVKIDGKSTAFQTVEGLEAKMATEEIKEGGENRFSYKVPGRKEFTNLKLKRALVPEIDSKLVSWCVETMDSDLSQPIKPKDIEVHLLNEQGTSIATWYFVRAYPVNWRVGPFDSMKDSEVLIEEIELVYLYASRKKSNFDASSFSGGVSGGLSVDNLPIGDLPFGI